MDAEEVKWRVTLQTGQEIDIAASNSVGFKAGKALKDSVSNLKLVKILLEEFYSERVPKRKRQRYSPAARLRYIIGHDDFGFFMPYS